MSAPAGAEGASLVLLGERGVLAVTGPQRQKFLHAMLSNDVAALAPGQGCLAALMDVKGHLLALLRVLVAEDAILLETNRDRLPVVEATLVRYRVAAPVRFAAAPSSVLAVLGEAAHGLVGGELGPPQAHARRTLGGHEVRVARASDLPGPGYVVHAPPEAAGAVHGALAAGGALPLDRAELDTRRVERGRPWYGPDVTEDNLLHETGLLAEYHSHSKGCYVGQEVVARLEGRGGHVSRALRGLRLEAKAAAGSSITEGGKEVGRVTTAGVSRALGPIAMGYVHRSAFAPGTAVQVDGRPATVAALPLVGDLLESPPRE